MGDFVKLERQGRIAILTLNHPDKLNAIGEHEDCADLVDVLDAIGEDRGVSVAILTGAGRAFSAGGNLQGMKDRNGIGPLEHPASTRANYRRSIQRIPRAFRAIEVPIIAAINGHAIGVGLDIACLCDIRISASTAKFGAGFIKMGLVPGDGGAWLLQRLLGYSRAAEILFTGDAFTADDALAWGLVSKVVSADKLMEAALDLADRIAVNPPRALRMAKRLFLTAQTAGPDEMLELSATMQAIAHETADHIEAVDAFLEKRPPVFTGK